ncbi:MAG: glycerol-3-phosphate responsive antiterminator [Acidobacteria bacterium]|nr:glycerol-3-phosphate responsive antiterminator [Acidobacteriota bacterium]
MATNTQTHDKPRRGYFVAEDLEEVAASEGDLAGGLRDCSIIAAVNDPATFDAALSSPPRALYLLTGNPLTLPTMLAKAREKGKMCLLNMDFLDGLARDRFAVEFLAAHGASGIVSTRFETLKAAQTLGLFTVQRTFAIDSAAVNAARKSLNQFHPDAVEVLPAIAAPKVVKRLLSEFPQVTVIGGGLIDSVKEIEGLLSSGVHAVTVSDPRLWII